MSQWSIIYEKAIRDDGTLWFPERLTQEFLNSQRRLLGSYIFANQYQNEVIPLDKQTFKKEWRKYYKELPQKLNKFVFVDPAISTADTADFTAVVTIGVDVNNNWYVISANRYRINPSEIINLLFDINAQVKPCAIGIEDVAYQKALLYMVSDEMRRRSIVIPVHGIKPGTDKTKEMRILSLVPRLEWGSLFLRENLTDLEDEMDKFPRAKYDDLLDALAYMDTIAYKPQPDIVKQNLSPNAADYEKRYLDSIIRGRPLRQRNPLDE